MPIIDKLRERSRNRGENSHALIDFLGNMYKPVKFMHKCLPAFQGEDEMLDQAIRQYAISLSTNLETYFRDLIIEIASKDENLLRNLISGNRKYHDLRLRSPNDISDAEIAAEMAHYQSLNEINQAYSKLVSPKTYIVYMTETNFLVNIPSIRSGPAELKMVGSWESDIRSLFDRRHQMVHDGNSKISFNQKEIRSIETSVLLLAQLTSLFIEMHTNVVFSKIMTNEGLPGIFLIKDIISDDWEVVE